MIEISKNNFWDLFYFLNESKKKATNYYVIERIKAKI